MEALVLMSILAATAQTVVAASTKLKKPTPTKPEAPADLSGQADERAKLMAEQRRRQAGQHGRASTIMSGSPLGQPGQVNTAAKYLTGQ